MIRGVIELPIQDAPECFGFGVWVTQKEENLQTYVSQPDKSEIGPFFRWLNTHISYYSIETQNLKTKAHFRGNDLRPLIELEATDHPLAIDQRMGISMEKALEIVHYYVKTIG